MFSSFVSASTVFTPGAGTGSVVSYWGTMAGVTLGIILTTIALLMFLVAIDIEQYEERMKVGKACFLLLWSVSWCQPYAIEPRCQVNRLLRALSSGLWILVLMVLNCCLMTVCQ